LSGVNAQDGNGNMKAIVPAAATFIKFLLFIVLGYLKGLTGKSECSCSLQLG
jgi:hypothetical protein